MAMAGGSWPKTSKGLARDKARELIKKPLPAATAQNVVGLALGPPPAEATNWTGRMLTANVAKAHRGSHPPTAPPCPHCARVLMNCSDPAHVAPIEGKEYAAHRGPKALHAAVWNDENVVKRARSAKVGPI
jgi:hypothetical protein